MTWVTSGSAGPTGIIDPGKAASGLSLAHPLSLRQADAVASDRCAPRAPGASVGESSSTVASPRAAWTSGEAARSRASCARMGSRRAGPAAATPPPMTTRLTPSVRESDDGSGEVDGHALGDLDGHRVADGSGAEHVRGARMGPQDRAATGGHRLVRLAADRRAGGDRLEAAAQSAWTDRLRPDRRRCGRPRRRSRCPPGAAPRRARRRRRCPVPIARNATLAGHLGGPVGGPPAQPDRRRAGVVLDEDRDAELCLAAAVRAAGR